MVNNQYEKLQGKIFVNSTPRSNHIFRFIEEGFGCFLSRDYHRESMAFIWENLAHKYCRIGSSEASGSFFYKIQKTELESSTVRQYDSSPSLSYLLIMGGTQNKRWGYLTEKKIYLRAAYIPSLSNKTADWAFRNFQNSTKWKLCPNFFKQICNH